MENNVIVHKNIIMVFITVILHVTFFVALIMASSATSLSTYGSHLFASHFMLSLCYLFALIFLSGGRSDVSNHVFSSLFLCTLDAVSLIACILRDA